MNKVYFEKWISRVDFPVNVGSFLLGLLLFLELGIRSRYLLVGLLAIFGIFSLTGKNLLEKEARLRAEYEVSGLAAELNNVRMLYLFALFFSRISVGLLMAYVILIAFRKI